MLTDCGFNNDARKLVVSLYSKLLSLTPTASRFVSLEDNDVALIFKVLKSVEAIRDSEIYKEIFS